MKILGIEYNYQARDGIIVALVALLMAAVAVFSPSAPVTGADVQSTSTVSPTGVILKATGDYIYLTNASTVEDLLNLTASRSIKSDKVIIVGSVNTNVSDTTGSKIRYYLVAGK